MKKIFVRPLQRIEAGMCIIMYRDNTVDSNVERQQRIQCMYTSSWIVLQGDMIAVKVDKKLFGMYTCICATGACSLDIMPEVGVQGIIKLFLYGDCIMLDLPSMISGSVVGYFQKVAICVFHGTNVIIIGGLPIWMFVVYLCYNYYKMIQRIQSIWLLLTAVVILGLFLFPYLNYIDLVGLGKQLYVTGSYTAVNNETVKQESYVLQTVATVVLGFIPIFTIFQYKNRKLQLKLIFIEIVLICLFAVWLFMSASNTLSLISQSFGAANIGVGFFLLPVAVIFLAMAIGGIRKDEKLIKSADRLR